MRLGLGEVEKPSPESYSRQFTQIRFLIIAERLEPQILIEVRDGIYPLFRDLLDALSPDERDGFYANLNTGWRFLERVPGANAFLDSLNQWAKRWNLEADWCIERIIMAMRRYYGIKTRLSDFSWFYPLEELGTDKDGKNPYKSKLDFIFDYPVFESNTVQYLNPPILLSPPGRLPDFNPYQVTLEGYLARIKWEAEERLKNDPILSIVDKSHQRAYVRQVRNKAADYGKQVMAYIESQSGLKEVETKLKLKTHLEWTVQVWVLGKSYTEVANSAEPKRNGERLTRKAITKAVKDTLDSIEPSWSAQLETRFPRGRRKEDLS